MDRSSGTSMRVTCKYCGRVNLEANISCAGCGAALPAVQELPLLSTVAQGIPSAVCDVLLVSFGQKKIPVIKVVRKLTGYGLKEAKDLVEAAPSTVLAGIYREDANAARARLEDAGGTARVVPSATEVTASARTTRPYAQSTPRQEGQSRGCLGVLYFLCIGWWATLYWLALGLFMMLTVIGAPIGAAFFVTAWRIATLSKGEETIGQVFKRHWQIGKSWYAKVPVIPRILPYWLALAVLVGALLAIGNAQPRTTRSSLGFAPLSYTTSEGAQTRHPAVTRYTPVLVGPGNFTSGASPERGNELVAARLIRWG